MKPILSLLFVALSIQAGAAELRGAWWWPLTNAYNPAQLSEITLQVGRAQTAQLTDLYMWTYSTHIQEITNGTRTDYIASALTVTGETGPAIHVWYQPFGGGGVKATDHPEWLVRKSDGTTNASWICLLRPEVRQWELDALVPLVSRYPTLAGIQLEEPGYEDINSCWCSYCTNYFQTNNAVNITVGNPLTYYNTMRDEYCAAQTAFVDALATACHAIRSDFKVTVSCQSSSLANLKRLGMDPWTWVSRNLTAYLVHQNYTTSTNTFATTLSSQMVEYAPYSMAPGIALSYAGTNLVPMIRVSQSAGALGFVLYDMRNISGYETDIASTFTPVAPRANSVRIYNARIMKGTMGQ